MAGATLRVLSRGWPTLRELPEGGFARIVSFPHPSGSCQWLCVRVAHVGATTGELLAPAHGYSAPWGTRVAFTPPPGGLPRATAWAGPTQAHCRVTGLRVR